MRAVAILATIASLHNIASASSSPNVCANGVHIIVARGTNEAPGSGLMESVAHGIAAAIPDSQIAPLDYPAAFDNYSASVAAGVDSLKTELAEYGSRCPQSKVALMGFSQGAHVMGDTLCGSVGAEPLLLQFNATSKPMSSSVMDQNVIAVILFGDPTHNASAPWNRGNSIRDGLYPREDINMCQQFASKIESWCDTGDLYCDNGNMTGIHRSYFSKYTPDAVEFVFSRFVAANASRAPLAVSPSKSSLALGSAGLLASGRQLEHH
ncbi:acetylxylan esterase 2 (cutinase) [Colletotrichum plurivorum]|uniref:Acetylxylan esterase 2 (Cutinase) n=1 Tax=Colletotrichum plurivorum TaxID=2175906 RepID=A0A8H6NLT3_9PEZI|nr:acetylxylan esterase 2 (cutinase) [Colletotrichum plurivorum]